MSGNEKYIKRKFDPLCHGRKVNTQFYNVANLLAKAKFAAAAAASPFSIRKGKLLLAAPPKLNGTEEEAAAAF